MNLERVYCQLRSWLDTSSIPYQQESQHIQIKAKNGEYVKIKASTKTFTKNGTLFFSASEFIGKNKEVSLRVFHVITQKLGYGKPIPINRGEIIKKRLFHKNDFELIALRHREFRRVPNLNLSRIEKYKNVIDASRKKFFKFNYYLLSKHQIDLDDLLSFAYVWTYNFAGLHEVYNTRDVNENYKRLSHHLKQRFYLLKSMLIKKGTNCFPDTSKLDEPIVLFEQEESVEEKLLAFLNENPPEKVEGTLSNISTNKKFDLKTRREAESWLNYFKSTNKYELSTFLAYLNKSKTSENDISPKSL